MWLAALAVRMPAGASAPARVNEAPRREQFFDRPFPLLLRCRGVWVPCALVEGEDDDAGAVARRELDARALALLN